MKNYETPQDPRTHEQKIVLLSFKIMIIIFFFIEHIFFANKNGFGKMDRGGSFFSFFWKKYKGILLFFWGKISGVREKHNLSFLLAQ